MYNNIHAPNSPVYRGVQKIESLKHAIPRIGLKETHNIVIAISVRSLFETNRVQFRQLMNSLWQHSLASAFFAKLKLIWPNLIPSNCLKLIPTPWSASVKRRVRLYMICKTWFSGSRKRHAPHNSRHKPGFIPRPFITFLALLWAPPPWCARNLPSEEIALCCNKRFLGWVATWILHESEAFICKALKGEAIVRYAEPLITQQMEASDSPEGWKLMRLDRLSSLSTD